MRRPALEQAYPVRHPDHHTGHRRPAPPAKDTTEIAHLSGTYAYDGIAGAAAPGWKLAVDHARAHDLIRSPSAAAGHLDHRPTPPRPRATST
ncbi:hypothetical protein [Streptomyces shenzhenensis]|uniref:hypothetical protein n=1 Tax=Streptomyces shenzhenensis TaxID=943815 RepID=UPI00367D872E